MSIGIPFQYIYLYLKIFFLLSDSNTGYGTSTLLTPFSPHVYRRQYFAAKAWPHLYNSTLKGGKWKHFTRVIITPLQCLPKGEKSKTVWLLYIPLRQITRRRFDHISRGGGGNTVCVHQFLRCKLPCHVMFTTRHPLCSVSLCTILNHHTLSCPLTHDPGPSTHRLTRFDFP